MGMGNTTQPAPAPVEEDREPSPFTQTLPGVFVDYEKAAELGYEEPQFDGVFDAMKQFFTGQLIGKQPPPEAVSVSQDVLNPLGIGGDAYGDVLERLAPELNILTTEETAAARARSRDEFNELVVENLQSQAQQFGVNVDPTSTVVADLIREKSEDMGLVEGQDQLYLADNQAEYTNALENIFGEGNVRVLPYDGPYYSAFSPEYYVSVRENADAEFTDFAPTVVNFRDYAERVAPGLFAETAAATAIVPAAMASGFAFGAIPVAGVVLGPAAFVYTLYVGGKSVEAGRQYLKDELGLTEEEAVEFSSVLDAANKLLVPQIEGVTTDQRTPAETQREIAGLFELAFAAVPALADKMKLAIGRVVGREDTTQMFGSAVRAQTTVAETVPGGTMDIGVPLEALMLQQVTPNKIVGRIASLSEQTSVRIPAKTREQMQSVVAYLTKYGDDLGAGDFKAFQSNVADIGETLRSVREAPEGTIPDLSTIGENIDALDDLFLRLRGIEARGMYNNVFDKLGNASYNLDNIRELIPKQQRSIIPVTGADATPTTRIEGAAPAPKRGEGMVAPLIDDLMSMGKVQKDGSRILTPQGIRAAVKKFQDDNPGFEFDPADIDTPAKLLQMYATRFGQLARDNFSTAGATPDPAQFRQAMTMRDALLELIGNPREEVSDIAEDLASANAFYKETFDLSSTDLQIQARNARRGRITPETATLPEAVATTPAGTGRTAPATVTMENINEQERYVREALDGIVEPEFLTEEITGAGTQLQEYFINVLASKLRRGMPTGAADEVAPNEVIKFLDSFEPRQLRALGLDADMEAAVRNDAELLAKMQKDGTLSQILMMPRTSQVADIFQDVMQLGSMSDFRIAFDQLESVIRRAPTPEAKKELRDNLRAGLLDHIMSTNGVFVRVNKPSAFGDVGEFNIDSGKFLEIIDRLKQVGAFEPGGILGPDEALKVQPQQLLETMAEYAAVINPAGADAGSALAGAQIIGEMFTLDPSKFISGLARLGSQARIAKLLANDDFVKLVTGTGKPMSRAERLRIMFFGKGSLGSIVAKVATEQQRPEDEQTNALLANEVDSDFARKMGLYGSYP